MTDRTQYVYYCSAFAAVHSGVHRGSVLGPILFTMYIKSMSTIIDSHSITRHSLADDHMTRYLLLLTTYQTYYTLSRHVRLISKLGQKPTCKNRMTIRQNSCLSPLQELRICIDYHCPNASVVQALGTEQLQANPPVVGPRLSPGKSTQRAITTMRHNDLVVGEDHMLGPSCRRYNWQTCS